LVSCSGPPGEYADGDETEVTSSALTAGGEALLVVGGAGNAADGIVQQHLETLGLHVAKLADTVATTADATGKRLVVISSTVASSNVGKKFTKVAVPVLTWEPSLYDDLGLTQATSGTSGTRASQTQLVMKVSSKDAMAAGVSGTSTVSSSSTFVWGKPGAAAKIVATTTAGEAAIFRFDRGAQLFGFTAPERRAGFFLSDTTASGLKAKGGTLLDAAITWTARLPQLAGTTCTTNDQCRSNSCVTGVCAPELTCGTLPSPTPPALKLTRIANVSGAGQLVGPAPGVLWVTSIATGQVVAVQDGVVAATPIVQVSASRRSIEQGLLGIALHPDFAINQRFFIFYSDQASGGATTIAEYLSTGPTTPATFVAIRYQYPHSHQFNNGGGLAFGPDKMLYFSVGDNASDGGPAAAARIDGRYGRILRIDPDTGMPASGNIAGFTWDYGLRNPYRISFDRRIGDLFISDAGNTTTEEIDFEPARAGGKNWGWTCSNCDGKGSTDPGTEPIVSFPNVDNAVIGGVVYRGKAIPGLCGRYFYSEWPSGAIRSFVQSGGRAGTVTTHAGLQAPNIHGFGEDSNLELYILTSDNTGTSGSVYRVDAQ
jgi:glucose/arabinose dehydrogenase